MKVKDGKIIEITETELFAYWLARGLDDIYSFPEYKKRMEDLGTVITD